MLAQKEIKRTLIFAFRAIRTEHDESTAPGIVPFYCATCFIFYCPTLLPFVLFFFSHSVHFIRTTCKTVATHSSTLCAPWLLLTKLWQTLQFCAKGGRRLAKWTMGVACPDTQASQDSHNLRQKFAMYRLSISGILQIIFMSCCRMYVIYKVINNLMWWEET